MRYARKVLAILFLAAALAGSLAIHNYTYTTYTTTTYSALGLRSRDGSSIYSHESYTHKPGWGDPLALALAVIGIGTVAVARPWR
jgi:hypothetical protein